MTFLLDLIEDPVNRQLYNVLLYHDATQCPHQSVQSFDANLSSIEVLLPPYTEEKSQTGEQSTQSKCRLAAVEACGTKGQEREDDTYARYFHAAEARHSEYFHSYEGKEGAKEPFQDHLLFV